MLPTISTEFQREFNGISFPLVLNAEELENQQQLLQWCRESITEIRELLANHGAVLLRGAPVHSATIFEQLLDELDFPRMPYIGGAAPRSQVTSRVLTSNESPPSEPIPFHHEMAQVPNPPAYIFFYADIPSRIGGETSILHSVRMAQRFEESCPDFFARVKQHGVRYVRVMPSEDDSTSAIGRSWRSTFNANTQAEAEIAMAKIGTSWEWQEDDTVITKTAVVPALRTSTHTGQVTFFNSMVAAYTGWIDSRNDPKKAVECGDSKPVDGDALLRCAEIMEEDAVDIDWQKGDVLLIDNQLVMHARRPFEGPRKILASISPMV